MQSFISLCRAALVSTALLSACSSETPETMPAETDAISAVTFQIDRAGESTDTQQSLTRLYAAERSTDHASATDGGLYSDPKFRLFPAANEFQVNGLKLQWYKFTLMQVPHQIGDEASIRIDGEQLFSDLRKDANEKEKTTRDFGELLIDYTDILRLQELNHKSSEDYDLHIYRAVSNRWMTRPEEGKEPPKETLTLRRITGQLELNMGILPDQFHDQVDKIIISAKLPTHVYISDNQLNDQHSEVNVETATETVRNYTYIVPEELSKLNATQPCILKMALLPCQLKGTITVSFKREGVQEQAFTIEGDGKKPVQIRPNTRTTVLFNGMYPREFEVRYAGFNGSSIDIDDEAWDGGWPEPAPEKDPTPNPTQKPEQQLPKETERK